MAYRGMNQYPQAIRDFSAAIDINPQHAEAYRERGMTQSALGQHESAMRDLDSAIRLAPQDAWSYVQRGEVYAKLANTTRAMQNYTQAIDMTRNEMQAAGAKNARSYLLLGVTYALSGQYETAIQHLDKAIELNPQLAAAYRERGLIHKRMGNEERALSDFQKAGQIEAAPGR
jgi:tetratricopeptide (TPR) repeat protein